MPRDDNKRDKDKVNNFKDASDETINSNDKEHPILDSLRKILTGDESDIFPEELLQQLEKIWDKIIVPVLIAAFGRSGVLYVIFYRSKTAEEIIMEIWDPKYVAEKPSEVFKFRGLFEEDIELLAKNREEAKILILEDWS